VTFNSNGGEAIPPQTVASGAHVNEPPIPLREGFLFEGWLNGATTWNFKQDVVTSDLTLTAQWIDATAIFEYEQIENSDKARIIGIKRLLPQLTVPTIIGGYQVTELADGLFAEFDAFDVQTIYLPPTITTVGEETFYNCKEVAIIFDDRAVITKLGAGAFYGCDKLSAIRLGEGLSIIDVDTFFGCHSLKTLQLPKSVTLIEENAFAGCESLVTVTFHSDLTEIRDSAFKDCTALKSIFFYGDAEQIDLLREEHTEPQNHDFLNATVYLYSETAPQETEKYRFWYSDENNKPRIW
jgi:uncharacterized repeat protein (TIGR02543 family)